MKAKTTLFRQGDVLLRRVSSIPKSAKAAEKKDQPGNSRIVLAYGEVTGHAHAIADTEACNLLETEDARILHVTGRKMRAIHCRNTKNGGECWIPADMKPDQYVDLESIGEETVMGVVLRHEEHNPFVITAGVYIAGGSGKTNTQREYSPEAIRNVQD